MIATRCGKVWLRIVSWDQLPHLMKSKPIKGKEFDGNWDRITWEQYRLIMTGTSFKVAKERVRKELING